MNHSTISVHIVSTGAGQNPHMVDDLPHPGVIARWQAIALLNRNRLLNPALALGQRLDQALIDAVDLLADLAHGQLRGLVHGRVLLRTGPAVNRLSVGVRVSPPRAFAPAHPVPF